MISPAYRCRYAANRLLFVPSIFVVGFVLIAACLILLLFIIDDRHVRIRDVNKNVIIPLIQKENPQLIMNLSYYHFTQWNRSLCSIKSDHRGPRQKVISVSIYARKSKYTDNPMYSWEERISWLLKGLTDEINTLLPTWILRVYIDFTGRTKSQQDVLYNFSNIDVCDMSDIPIFGSSLLSFLPGKMWRFLPVFDPFVDYSLTRYLDSQIVPREIETINMWLLGAQKKMFFHILRDHASHETAICGGLWGAAMIRAREKLFDIFKPMLIPSIARRYNFTGDQQFLTDYIWDNVSKNSLIFDSYYCKELGGQPFLSQRPRGGCFVGCTRPCCKNMTNINVTEIRQSCPIACRPEEHPDWTYC